jgi:hypothetical protein
VRLTTPSSVALIAIVFCGKILFQLERRGAGASFLDRPLLERWAHLRNTFHDLKNSLLTASGKIPVIVYLLRGFPVEVGIGSRQSV